MKRVLLFLLLALPIWASAQFTATNSSFSNGSAKGSDGTFTLTSLLGSSGLMLSSSPAATVVTSDSLALVAFYNSTNGAAWTNKTNWLTGPVNTWFGVTISANRVTELNLPINNLSATLPDLSALAALKRLDLRSNNFAPHPIPVTLNSLVELEYLDLGSNRFNGNIPNLGGLTNLKYLSLANSNFLNANQLFPTFLYGLTALENLNLRSMRLAGALPDGINTLTRLKILDISFNGLSASTVALSQLASITSLEVLNLNSTNFSGLLPASILTLPNLSALGIDNTAFSELPAPEVWSSFRPTQLNISNCSFDFGDLEPLMGISSPQFINTGQRQFSLFSPGTTITSTNPKLLEGDPFVLTPIVGGTQNSYQWYFNGLPMTGATNLTLDLANLELAETGTYRLQVTSALVTGITLVSFNLQLTIIGAVESLFSRVTTSAVGNEVLANSSGGYWADIDADGDEDLFVGNNFSDVPNFLYENLGNGNFSKITAGDIVTIPDGSRYVSWGDYNNDGYPDIFVGEYVNLQGSPTNDNISSLYRNNGNKTFMRIPVPFKSDGGLWADYDRDGDLDLFMNGTSSTPNSNKLYKNKGDGTFELIDAWIPVTGTWYAGWVDIDNDDDLDYNITPGTLGNQIKIFRNNSGSFAEENLPVPSGSFNHRGSSWADIDGDGDMDLFAMNSIAGSTAIAESQFYLNNGMGQFTMEPASIRLGVPGWAARGSTFGDADNDGDLDLFIIHRPSLTSTDIVTQLFLNNGVGQFTAVPLTQQSFGFSDFATGLSLADYDNDGRMDLFIGSFEPLRQNYLYRNQTSNGNNWLKLKLVGMVSNKTAIGARVDVYAAGKLYHRQIMPSSGLSSQNSYIVHSGLASAAFADSVVIHWPSGLKQRFDNVPGNQQLTIIEGQVLPPFIPATDIVFSAVTNNAMTISFTPGNGEKRVVLMKEIAQAAPASGGAAAEKKDAAAARQAAPASGDVAVEKKDAAQAAPAAGPAAAQKEAKKVACVGCVYIEDGIELLGNSNFILANEYLGWKVVYVGNANSINVNSLRGNSYYEVTVVEYNGSGAGTKYLNNGATTATQRTLPDVLAPTTAASNISFSNVLATSMQVNFAPGNGEQRLAILKTGTPPVFLPSDDAFYSGDLGNGEQVVYNGNGNSFTLSQLLPDTEYFITLYEFNTDSTLTKYLTAGAPVASQRTLALPLVYVTTPANGAVNQNVRLNLTSLAVSGATNYTIQVSTDSAFTQSKTKSGGRTLLFDSLLYNQTYYTRVKTDLRPDYGKLTTFTTATPEFFSYVTSPANNATNAGLNLNVTANLVQRATIYTIELNTDPLFGTSTAIVRSGARTLTFNNLSFSTTYYSRVKTNLSSNWGATRQFRTGDALALSYIISPANNATNVSWMPTVTANTIPGATSYTLQLCTSFDFQSSPIIEMAGTSTSYLFLGLAYNTRYYARVFTDLTPGSFGPVRSFTTGNPISYSFVSSPANLAVGTNTSLNITSNAVPGAFTYRIQLSENPDFSTVDFDVTGSNRTLAFSGLKFLTRYYNRVQTDLDPGFGAVRSFTTADPTALAYVTAPGNTVINQNTVLNITSNTVGGASLYTIQLSETSDFANVAFEVSGPTRTLAFSGLKYNTTYYNRVGTDLTTLFGQVRSFTTRTAESIAFVTSPANSSINASTVLNITSNNVPGATNYTIQLSETSDFSVIAFEVSSPTRTLPFSGLKYNTTYYNRVLTDQSTIYGQVRNFTTRTAESLAFITSPANNAVNVINTTLNVVSNIVPGATTYTIQLSESADFATIVFEATSASNTMAFAGLKYNTTYFNRVRTNLSASTGQVRSFTTRTAESLAYVTSPGNNATNVNNATVNVTSNLVPGASNYLIQLSVLPDFSSIAFQANGTGRTYTFTGLNYNTRYYNRVLTDQSALFGPVRSFTTRTAESLAYVTNPANGASNIITTPSITSNTVPGAATYTIQLSRLLDFSVVDFEVSGSSRTLPFSGLLNSTRYFNRVRTNLSTEFGVVRSFTTMGTPPTLRIAINPEPEKAISELREFEVRVFPNPFKEKVSIFVESIYPEVELTLSDMTGRVVHTSIETTNKSIEIERHLAVGVYLLRAVANNRSEIVRVVKIE